MYSLTELKLGTITQPGPGFMPFIGGVGITLLSAFWILSNIKKIKITGPLWQKGELKNPLLAVIIIIAYTALIDRLGYILSTLMFLVAWQFAIEREKWLKTSIIAIVGTAVMYLLFAFLLEVQLPEGILNI
jgi:putative tricarboxylic transport membrane protein